MSLPPSDRFWSKVDKTGVCWLWIAATHPDGYGKFWDGERVVYAHRWAYTSLVGAIPSGLTLDHLCRVRSCVNPTHLEPVTAGVNAMRGQGPAALSARATSCPQGHPYDEANTYWHRGYRQCRTCRAAQGLTLRTCEPCGVTMYRSNMHAHLRTAKHLAAVGC